MKLYEIHLPDLTNQVALCPVQENHASLLALLRTSAPRALANIKLLTKVGGWSKAKRKVLNRDATVVSEDHQQWLRAQLEADGGQAATTFRRLAGLKLYLSVCELDTLLLVHDRQNDNPADFVQVKVQVENEFVDCELFNPRDHYIPTNERELLQSATNGYPVPTVDRLRIRPCAYSLDAMVDVGIFVDEAEGLDRLERALVQRRKFDVKDFDGTTEVMSMDQLDPGWNRFPFKLRRIFADWMNSSAGKSGARFCDHWYLDLRDHTEPRTSSGSSARHMHFTPQWTTSQKLAEIESGKGNDYTFVGNLEKLDRRVKVPFGWYFFMLHGNRVSDGAGKRMLRIVEDGIAVMPECDYQVLRQWVERRYGF